MTDNLFLLEECAKRACNGNIHVRLAKSYWQKHEWGKAVIALEQALPKGSLEEPVNAFQLLADVHLKLDHRHLAQRYYKKATDCLYAPS